MMHGALQVFLLLADARVTPDPDNVVTCVTTAVLVIQLDHGVIVKWSSKCQYILCKPDQT